MKKEFANQNYAISPRAEKLDNGKWKPICTVYEFLGNVGDEGTLLPCNYIEEYCDTEKEAIEKAIQKGQECLELIRPTNPIVQKKEKPK